MSCDGVLEFAFGRIGDDHHTGGIHGGSGLLKDGVQAVIDLGEQVAGIEVCPAVLLQQRSHHAGDQSGAYTVAHDIADEDADSGVRDWKNTEKITAHHPCGLVDGVKLQGAVSDGSGAWNAGKMIRQQRQLQLPRHRQLLLHLLVLRTQLLRALGDALGLVGMERDRQIPRRQFGAVPSRFVQDKR